MRCGSARVVRPSRTDLVWVGVWLHRGRGARVSRLLQSASAWRAALRASVNTRAPERFGPNGRLGLGRHNANRHRGEFAARGVAGRVTIGGAVGSIAVGAGLTAGCS
jgi:hypothetical protein